MEEETKVVEETTEETPVEAEETTTPAE